jgi:uncharacterized protein (DUF58 family)
MPRITGMGRFLSLAALVYALVLIGLVSLNGGPLALAAPLVVYLASTLLFRPPQIALRAERNLSAEMVKHDTPIEVIVRVTNDGPDLDELLLEDRLPRGLVLIEGSTSLLTSLPIGATAEMRYTVRVPRGSYYFQDLLASASDHLGVLRERALLPARRRLLALPDVTRLRRVAIRPPRTHGHFGPIPSRQASTGVDFYGLREYQPGDPRRWINWRVSQRHDRQIFVNQFEQERIADVGVILDARQQSNVTLPGENGGSLFEYSVQAAGSLSAALLDDSNRVGLLVYGYGVERTFPGYGKVQQERILRALGAARTGHNFALESLGYLPTRFFPTGSQIVMVSPLLTTDVPAFVQLRACGYEVLVVSPDPVSYEARALGVEGELPWRLARAERALLLRKLLRMGIRVLDWDVDKPFEPLARAALGRVVPGRQAAILRIR